MSDLLSDLKINGVDTFCIENGETADHLYLETEKDTLCICGMKNSIEYAVRFNVPYITYLIDDRDSLCIVEGFDEITADFCEKMLERAAGIPWVIVETERLIIREFSESDDLGFLEEPWCDKEYIKSYMKNQYRLFGYGIWAVCLREGGSVIGQAGVYNSEKDGKIELGYGIIESMRRRGYGFEAARAICIYAKEKLFADKLYVSLTEDNIASKKLFLKLKSAENIDNIASLEYTNR